MMYVPAICHVIAASGLVCAQVIGTKNVAVALCNKGLVVARAPIGDGVGFVDPRRMV
jgi:hypothetical protein